MLTILTASPRTGKTCYMTYKAITIGFDRSRTRLMQREIAYKQSCGFTSIKTMPEHCISANYDITLRKFGYSPRYSRRINPYRLGFSNPYVKTHFNFPYECICITEAQKYFNSRMSLYYPDWQSRWFEQHGHNDIDVFMDTQRPDLIDANIRSLSQYIEIMKLTTEKDPFGMPCRLIWNIRRFDNCWLYDEYLKSGKRDKSCYTSDVEIADCNVFACYDYQSCKPKFYDGHFNQDFDYLQSEITDDTLEDYVRILKKFDDELPDKFYIKKGKTA